MDSRDIKEEPLIVSQFLESMFDLQSYLIESYTKIEGIPTPPIDVNTKKSQQLIKDFSARVIEELAEGFESLQHIHDTVLNTNYFFVKNENTHNQLLPCFQQLQNLSEELADALHFYLELLIYINVDPDSIITYIQKFVPEVVLQNTIFDDKLTDIMEVGNILIRNHYPNESFISESSSVDLYGIASSIGMEVKHKNLKKLGSRVDVGNINTHKSILWDITQHINIARNFLKNKPWKQTEMLT